MTEIAGVILAGGRATRMGGRDKGRLLLDGRRLIDNAIERLRPQVTTLAISSNAGIDHGSGTRIAVLPDLHNGGSGPLAGILAGLRWAATLAARPAALVSVAVDTPFFPIDLAPRLQAGRDGQDGVAMASSFGIRHPTFALWPLSLADALQAFIDDGTTLKVAAFAESWGCTLVEFPQIEGADPFFNINTPADLERAHTMVGGRS